MKFLEKQTRSKIFCIYYRGDPPKHFKILSTVIRENWIYLKYLFLMHSGFLFYFKAKLMGIQHFRKILFTLSVTVKARMLDITSVIYPFNIKAVNHTTYLMRSLL